MNRLLSFYKNSLRLAFILVMILGVLLGAKSGSESVRSAFVIAGFVFLALEAFIRRALWKVFNGELNVQGRWKATTTYNGSSFIGDAMPSGFERFPLPKTSSHEVRFTQDCLQLAIEVSGGEDFPRFYSLAADLHKDKTALQVRYSYKVEYNQKAKSGCPDDEAIGYEVMTVDQYEELTEYRKIIAVLGLCKAKPVRMTGKFWHCAREGGIAYRGTAMFWRLGACDQNRKMNYEQK